jgi:hypothetical protein
VFRNPGTPGGRTYDSDEEVMSRPPAGTRVGQSRPGPVEKDDPDSTAHAQGKRMGQSVPIEKTDAEPGEDWRRPDEVNLHPDYN